MQEDKRNIIKFEMSDFSKFALYKFPIIALLALCALFIITIFEELRAKQNLNYILTGPFIFYGLFSSLYLIVIYRIRRAKMISMLTIDREKKEFYSYIYDIKKEIKFGINDIAEIKSSPQKFRFSLKDGTWVTWRKNEMNQQFLEEIIKSFEIPIIDTKKL